MDEAKLQQNNPPILLSIWVPHLLQILSNRVLKHKFSDSSVSCSGRFARTFMANPCMISTNSRSSTCVLVGAGYYSSSLLASQERRRGSAALCSRLKISAETMTTEKHGIKVERNPPESKLSELGVRQWPKWGCPPSKFPWTYSAKETCYLLKGKVKVYPEGFGDEYVEIGAGDFVAFPKGMSCIWDVSETVDKHYNFE